MLNRVADILRKPVTGVLLSIVIGFIVGAIVLSFSGYNPLEAYKSLFMGVFSKPKYIVQTIIIATPIIITGVSVSFAFKTGLFNIGAEGQFMAGAVAAAFVGYKFALPLGIHILAVFAAAMLAGALWGGMVGYLKAKFGIHEVITSIMLNWIALYCNNLYVTMPGIKKPNTEASYEVLGTALINVWGRFKQTPEGIDYLNKDPFLSEVLLKTDLNYGIFIAIAVAIVAWIILKKTTLGFSLRAVGSNKDAAELAGVDIKKNLILSMAIAGAIAGIAGAVYISGMSPHRISTLAVSENYGFNGLSVSLIAGTNPIACIFAGLLFGTLKYGGGSVQSELGAPSEIINIMIGTIIFFIAVSRIFVLLADKLKKAGGGK